MNPKCNQCGKVSGRNSTYRRKSDGEKVTQYRCFTCRRVWTDLTDNLEKRQKIRSINQPLRKLFGSSMTMRRAAKFFGVNQKTIARRVPYLAAKAKAEAEAMRLLQGPEALSKDVIYFDELITFEHTRCKPLSVFMAVSQKREILGFSVSSMPPHGRHLRKIALQKYGKRPDLRRKGALACLDQIRPFVGKKTVFKSDQQFFYPALVAKKFPENKHLTFQSKRAVVAGFGELKDKSFDPLFAINHSLAMLRGNLARLARRTWVTTKKAERLTQFLFIYMSMHNVDLLSKAS